MNLGSVFSVSAHVMAIVWVAGAWQGALFVGLALILLLLMPRCSASHRHGALIVLFVLAIGLPWLSLLHPAEVATRRHSLQISGWVAIVIASWWAVATLYRAISLTIAWQYLREVRRNALPIMLNLDGADIAVNRRPSVCTSAYVNTPVIVGFFQPMLLLPEWLAPQLSAEEFRQIALHECEHLRRRDVWTNLWLQIGILMFPLNPALLWLNRRIGLQRELACDAAVVAATARPTEYAASLVKIASERRLANPLRLALAAWGRQSEISQRVQALLDQRPKWTRLQRAVSTSSAICLLIVTVGGLALAPQLVSMQSPLAITAGISQHRASAELVDETFTSKPRPAAARFVPGSFVEPVTGSVRLDARHGVFLRSRKRALRQAFTRASRDQSDDTFSRRLGARSDVDMQGETLVAVQYDAPVRAVPALFVPTYLAVPVSGGWIMIQL